MKKNCVQTVLNNEYTKEKNQSSATSSFSDVFSHRKNSGNKKKTGLSTSQLSGV
jgi:hypothetical protein